MQDGIIAETGNSRYLRTIAGIKQMVHTLDDLLDLMIKGEFPIDWAGKNPDGWAQAGTDLNKANLLTDATAALMNPGPEATPDQMLAALANVVKTSGANVTHLTQKVDKLITYGTAGLTAGTSNLATGTIYVKYE